MDGRKKHHKIKSRIALAALLVYMSFFVQAHAVEIVSGRYLSISATEITLEVKVGSPAPASIIIIQHLPQGTTPTAADPPYKKFNTKKGEVRWLLRKVPPGTLSLQLKLSAPVNPEQISAEIRCMDPATGKLVTTQVK
ncbi:MAG: hypothetical protein U9P36_08030 [Thermodesulfobacteriota bacterium]|nr:hypothetical protein [Thermodesulfobacteriota bacterium]